MESLTVLAIFAHPDDEVGAIGTLLNHVRRGDDVHIVILTHGENASSFTGTKEEIALQREAQVTQIEQELGLKYRLLDFPDSGVFPSVDNAKKVASIIKEIRPNIIVTWNQSIQLGVGHPDHRYTFPIVLDAMTYARLKNDHDIHPPYRERISLYTTFHADSITTPQSFFVDVSEEYNNIMRFFDLYEGAYGTWPVREYKISTMKLLGRLCGAQYAEAFTKLVWREPKKYFD